MPDDAADVHRTLLDLTLSVGRIEGQMTQLVSAINQRVTSSDKRDGDIDRRLRKVEGRQHWYAGAAAAIGVLFEKFVPGIMGHST